MRTLKQHQEAIDVMNSALQLSLGRLLTAEHRENEREVNLHFAMIVFYQRLKTLLVSPEFIKFFNANLTHLLDEHNIAALLKIDALKPYQIKVDGLEPYKIPEEFAAQELFFMIAFSAIITSEAQKALDKYRNTNKNLYKVNSAFLCVSGVGMIAMAILFGSAIYSAALPISMLYLGMIMLNIIANITTIYEASRSLYATKIENKLIPVEFLHHSNNDNSIENIINSKNNPSSSNLFALRCKVGREFKSIQYSFFSLPHQSTITQSDLSSAQVISEVMTLG